MRGKHGEPMPLTPNHGCMAACGHFEGLRVRMLWLSARGKGPREWGLPGRTMQPKQQRVTTLTAEMATRTRASSTTEPQLRMKAQCRGTNRTRAMLARNMLGGGGGGIEKAEGEGKGREKRAETLHMHHGLARHQGGWGGGGVGMWTSLCPAPYNTYLGNDVHEISLWPAAHVTGGQKVRERWQFWATKHGHLVRLKVLPARPAARPLCEPGTGSLVAIHVSSCARWGELTSVVGCPVARVGA